MRSSDRSFSRNRLPRLAAAIAFQSTALAAAVPCAHAAQTGAPAMARVDTTVQQKAQPGPRVTVADGGMMTFSAAAGGGGAEVRTAASSVDARDAVTVMPFGRSETVLNCTVLRACVVELQQGEVLVNEPVAGDQTRWIIAHARAGPGGGDVLVVVKPKACDVTTNLVLSTNRRIYDLDLDSPPCAGHAGSATNPKRGYMRHIRFSYPADSSLATRRVAKAVVSDSLPHEDDRVVSPSRPLNREYGVVRARRGPFGWFGEQPLDFPWVPTTIADDGAHVYITLPREARQHPAPVLYAVENDGSRTLVNYTMRDTIVVTDRTFRRGVFVIAAGEREQRLEFDNLAWIDGPDDAGREP